MKAKDIFTTKRNFDLEKAVPLTEVKKEIVLNDFEVYFSKKYSSEFTVIETEEGNLIYSWSKVIADKFKKVNELPYDEWKGLVLKVVKRNSENGRTYFDLEAV